MSMYIHSSFILKNQCMYILVFRYIVFQSKKKFYDYSENLVNQNQSARVKLQPETIKINLTHKNSKEKKHKSDKNFFFCYLKSGKI